MYSFQKVETVAFEKVRRLPYETSNSVNVLKCVGIQFLSPLFVLVFARLPKNVWKSSANFGWSSEIYGRVLVIARGQGPEVFQNVRAIFVDLREGSGDLWKHLENIQLPSAVFGMFQVSLFHLVLPSLDKSVSVLTSDIFVLILTVVFQINL